MIKLFNDSIIEWISENPEENKLERVLRIDAENGSAFVIDLKKNNALPQIRELSAISEAFSLGVVIKRTTNPLARLYPKETDIPEKHRQARDRAFSIIDAIVSNVPDAFDSKLRGIMIREACEKYNAQKKDVYRYLSRYWQSGGITNALLPNYDKCGSAGEDRGIREGSKRGRKSRVALDNPEKAGINIDEDIKHIFRIGVKLYYNTKEKNPLRRCYQLIIENHFNVGYKEEGGVKIPILPPAEELPTFGEFRYWYSKEIDFKASLTAREGSRGFSLRHRAVLGSSTQMAVGPGSIYQIDATVADVYLVNSFDRTQIIGRPVIYIVIDVFSRYITGLYVGVEGPSWIGAKMALANAFTDKVSYCAEFGIEIEEDDWYCPFLPESLLADRGELIGFNSDNIVEFLNTKVSNTPPYRADWKGIIEQNFRLLNLKSIHWLPGAIKERFRERGEKDHRLDATLDLNQFTKIMIRTILNHNNYHRMHWYSRDEFMIQEHVEPIPTELWSWGLQNRSGHLREKPTDLIMLNLMSHDQATVTEFGIKFKGMHYTCDQAIKEQWFERARARGSWKVPIAYDTRKANFINLILNNGKSYEVCQLLDKDARYRTLRFEEALDLHEVEKLKTAQYESTKQQAGAELNAHINAIVEEGERQTENAHTQLPKSNAQRTSEIRSNRKNVREEIREKQSWDLAAETLSTPDVAKITTENNEQIEPKLTKHQSFLKLLKGQQKGSQTQHG